MKFIFYFMQKRKNDCFPRQCAYTYADNMHNNLVDRPQFN